MFPTAAGTALLHHARLIMRNVSELETELVDFAGGVRGTIRVQSNATAMASYLPDDLRTFLQLFPQVRVELEERTSPDTVRAVTDNAADIGIYGDVVVPTDLDTAVYRMDRLALLVPNGHPLAGRETVTFNDTTQYEYIGAPKGSSIDILRTRAAADIGVSLKMSIRSTGFAAISAMVDAGLGVAVVPEVRYADLRQVLCGDDDRAQRALGGAAADDLRADRNSLTPAAAASSTISPAPDDEAVPVGKPGPPTVRQGNYFRSTVAQKSH